MGGATRFMTLLTSPFPPIRPSLILLHRCHSTLSITPLRLLTFSSPSNSKPPIHQPVKCFHSPPENNTYAIHSAAQQQQQNHHPWPEWTQFLNVLSNGQGYSALQDYAISDEDAFVVYEQLTDEFVSAASRCIAFARARPDLLGLLSRRDIEAVVSNGTPFLFKSALNTSSRMRAFLGTNASNVSQVDQANTIDLMKYIISYASNPVVPSERNGLYSKELVDSSVRNLLLELGRICGGAPTGRDEHAPMPFGQNIEMKRGDWICPKCSFMNFARNMKCLECEESRPRRQLSGGEWDCPQCNFFNYGRNRVCLRCECRRPGAPPFNNSQNIGTTFSPPPPNDAFSTREQTFETSNFSNQQGPSDRIQSPVGSSTQLDIQNETQKSERWFQRISELHNVKDLPSAVSDEDFPEIMPMRKGENRFVVSKKKDRSLTSPQYKRQAAMDQANNTNFVPFVPFPPDYFARKDPAQPISPVDSNNGPSNNANTTSPVNTNPHNLADTGEVSRMHNHPTSSAPQFSIDNTTPSSTSDGYSETGKASELAKNETVQSGWAGPSLEGSAVRETDPLDMSEEAKAERWFKRVAQIKDISELSQIPDEDFPSIMPMRKGVNRFVVSKRKTPLERRLTSQQYRRNLPVVSNDSVKKESEDS